MFAVVFTNFATLPLFAQSCAYEWLSYITSSLRLASYLNDVRNELGCFS